MTATSARTALGGAVLRVRVTDAITEATFLELAEVGYARMSMEAVARRAGVGKAALYRRWASKQEMLSELIRHAVEDSLPPAPNTGALRTDLQAALAAIREQLADPLVNAVAAALLAETRRTGALSAVLHTNVAAPRRAAARLILEAAIDRGELPVELDMEVALDLIIAPLSFRILVLNDTSDDGYLETLSGAVEAALKAAVRRPHSASDSPGAPRPSAPRPGIEGS